MVEAELKLIFFWTSIFLSYIGQDFFFLSLETNAQQEDAPRIWSNLTV